LSLKISELHYRMSHGQENTPHYRKTDKTIFRGEYIWIDGYSGLRSKTKIVRWNNYTEAANLFEIFGSWNFDGSSTHQATTESSEVHLKPVLILPDVGRGCGAVKDILNYLVLCETYTDSALTKPHPSNTRYAANKIMEQFADQRPLFGIEQEFFLFDNVTGRPCDWTPDLLESSLPSGSSCLLGDKSTFPSFSMRHDNSGKERHYCSVGAGKVSHRDLLESVVNEMLALDFNITGMNYEVAPGQAEIQICEYGIKAADHLVLLRYLLARAAERENLRLDISSKPIKNGDWNGSGCHVNFSTEAMRNDGGYEVIMASMSKLAVKHEEHIACYGDDNKERLTGLNETSSMHVFNYGVGHRGASIRIPSTVVRDGKGYFEDRRPSGSMDPYKVTSKIVETVCQ
jgi:glutamine synthetase